MCFMCKHIYKGIPNILRNIIEIWHCVECNITFYGVFGQVDMARGCSRVPYIFSEAPWKSDIARYSALFVLLYDTSDNCTILSKGRQNFSQQPCSADVAVASTLTLLPIKSRDSGRVLFGIYITAVPYKSRYRSFGITIQMLTDHDWPISVRQTDSHIINIYNKRFTL